MKETATTNEKGEIKLITPKRKPTTQEQIIRQSSMNRSVELICSDSIPLEELYLQAESIERWIHREI